MSVPRSQTSLFWWWIVGLILALAIAAAMRLPFFGSIPNGLNRDEAALGYNAYSLLKIGKDEFGQRWPVSITSFGDQKLPGYVYTLVPFIAVFGLHPATVRLPSLFAGFFIIVGMGVLALQIGKRLQLTPRGQYVMSFLTMLFLAISPWADHFSRTAYEAHLAMMFFIFATVVYFYALEQEKHWLQRFFLIIAACGWSITLLTYHSYHVFTPLFILFLLVVHFPRLRKMDAWGMGMAWLIGCLTIVMLYKGGVFQANQVKSNGISPFHKDVLLSLATEYRNFVPGENSIYERILFNPMTEAIVVFAQNILTIFSGTFFFIHGSGHGDHDPGNTNNFHPFIAPFLLIGFLYLWNKRRELATREIVAWVGLALIAPALTIQPQHEIRLSPLFPMITLVAALGVVYASSLLHRRAMKIVASVIFGIIVFLAAGRTYLQYTYIIPARIESNDRYHILARVLANYQKTQLPVITQSPSSSPYIWYVFENRFDPQTFLSQVERYPADEEGFLHVKRIGNVYFEHIDWDQVIAWAHKQPLILVLQPKELPVDKPKDNHFRLLETVRNEKNQVIYEVWQLNEIGSSVKKLAGSHV